MRSATAFWNRFADRYAARPIRDVTAHEAMLADVAARLRPGDRVLEIGCGTGSIALRLAGGVSAYVATDFSDGMIRIAQARSAPPALRFQRAEAADLPGGGPFDAVCAFSVLHLVEDLPHLLRRLHEGLVPGGLLICKTWCFGDLPLRYRLLFRALRRVGLFPPARFLTQAQVQSALAQAGFTIAVTRIFGSRAQAPYIVARADPVPLPPKGALR